MDVSFDAVDVLCRNKGIFSGDVYLLLMRGSLPYHHNNPLLPMLGGCFDLKYGGDQ